MGRVGIWWYIASCVEYCTIIVKLAGTRNQILHEARWCYFPFPSTFSTFCHAARRPNSNIGLKRKFRPAAISISSLACNYTFFPTPRESCQRQCTLPVILLSIFLFTFIPHREEPDRRIPTTCKEELIYEMMLINFRKNNFE